MTASKALKLDTIGRVTIDGVEWVAYSDGAYRHVVKAEYYDADIRDLRPWVVLRDDDEGQADAYSQWCGLGHKRGAFADDDTTIAVARALEMSVIHSATDGVCSTLIVEEDLPSEED